MIQRLLSCKRNATMRKYIKYKNSGIPWIGQIPEHWEVKKAKYCLTIINGCGFKEDFQGQTSGDLPFCKASDINGHSKFVNKAANYVTKELANQQGYNIVPIGAIIFAKIGEALKKNHRKINQVACIVDNNCAALVPNDCANIEFMYYLYQSIDMVWYDNAGTIPCVNNQKLLNSILPLPPLSEQRAIAEYLDKKTEKIDDSIEALEQQKSDLQKYRTSVISEAVTRGLDAAAKMKDSGVEWIGQIPEGWKMTKLKYLTSKIGSGVTPSGGAAVYQDNGVLFIRSQNVYADGLRLEDATYISEEIDNDMQGSRIMFDDVLLNITGASIGRCTTFTLKHTRANVNQHVCIVRPIQELALSRHLQYVLNSSLGQTQIAMYQTGGNREGLNFEQLKNFLIPVPPLSEQQAIAEYLDKKTAKIDESIALIDAQIADLCAYRTSLITEAVTGKVDVR